MNRGENNSIGVLIFLILAAGVLILGISAPASPLYAAVRKMLSAAIVIGAVLLGFIAAIIVISLKYSREEERKKQQKQEQPPTEQPQDNGTEDKKD